VTKLLSTEALLAHSFPTPAYLIEPIVPQAGIVVMHGKPNVGKTQAIITITATINAGAPLFNKFPVNQGPVVIIQADMTGNIQQARALQATSEVSLAETYWLVEEDGSVPMVNIQSLPLNTDLIERIAEIDPVLIVWDTARKVHRLDENKSETPIKVFDAARSVCPLATHWFNHHNRKESRDPDATSDPAEDAMGNIQWSGAADTTMNLINVSGRRSPKRLAFQTLKSRTAPDFLKRPIILEMSLKTILLNPVD